MRAEKKQKYRDDKRSVLVTAEHTGAPQEHVKPVKSHKTPLKCGDMLLGYLCMHTPVSVTASSRGLSCAQSTDN